MINEGSTLSRRGFLAGGLVAVACGPASLARERALAKTVSLEAILGPDGFDDEARAFSNDALLRAAISEVSARGGRITGGRGRAVWLGNMHAELYGSLLIELDEGTVFKGAREVPKQIMVLGSRSGRHSCTIKNAKFDLSHREYLEIGAGGTALSLIDVDDWLLNNCHWYASEGYRTDRPRGDNAVSTNGCGRGGIRGGSSRGICTTAFYFTRDTGDPSNGEHFVEGHSFYRCKTAASAKNEIQSVRYANNRVIECENGFSRLETDLAGPAMRMKAYGNEMRRLGGFAFRSRGFGTDLVTHNVVEDWGTHYDGAEAIHKTAVSIQGAKECVYSDNVFTFAAYNGSGCTAFALKQRKLFGVNFEATGNQIIGNRVERAEIGIKEEEGAVRNVGIHNSFVHVRHPLLTSAESNFHL